ncbi:MAG: NAD(P)/FAD-dependent oxidoreductase [Steroidobacteraceae bacterium]
MQDTILIIGASHAAAQAVDSLRREGHTGPVTLAGDEPWLPYQRPPLSKKFLTGELEAERLWIRPEAYYAKQGVELKLGQPATAIDRGGREVAFADGSRVAYSRLLLATGARPRAASLPGAALAGVHSLRSLADVEAIRTDLAPGRRAVLIGAGFIGLECAASLVRLGLEVTVLEMAERVMSRMIAPEMSTFYRSVHEAEGVRLLTGQQVSAIEGEQRVSGVRCADGSVHPADLVIVAIGVQPNLELAASAGLACDNGIAVDEYCRSSDPNIYAIGDCCSFPSQRYGRRVRLESVDNACEQAKTAAANLCGKATVHDKLPWFWSDQYELKLQIVGLSQDHDRVILRGEPASRKFSCCYLRGQELLALDAVNQPGEFMAARRLIGERARFDLDRLADPSIPLKDAALLT